MEVVLFYEHFNSRDEKDFGFFPLTDFAYPAHLHKNFELIIVLEGELFSHVDGRPYRVGAGEALLVFPYQIHSHDCAKNMVARMVIFSPGFVTRFMNMYHEQLPCSNKFIYHGDVDIDFKGSFFLRISYLYQVLGEFLLQNEFFDKGELPSNELISNIIDYIYEHYREHCSLEDIAEHLGYSSTYISKYFKSRIGLNFKQYVNTLRLNHACERLKYSTQENISSIAFESGFSSLCTFNREFKRQFGIIPSEFRLRHQKET